MADRQRRRADQAEARAGVPEAAGRLEEAGLEIHAERAGGVWKKLYAHSLSAALLLLFAASGVGHFVASWRQHAEDQARHGEPVTPMADYLGEPQFWFESFQNWQSEFLAVVALVLLSIWLREKDSTQSKPLTARHTDTGH